MTWRNWRSTVTREITIRASVRWRRPDVPIDLTVKAGNINDQTHMRFTYGQVRRFLEPGSSVVFNRGANDKTNLNRIELDGNDYLTAKKLNSSDDAVFQTFSEKLKRDHLKSRRRKAERLFAEAVAT